MKTYTARPTEIERGWFLIDADGLVLGRLATQKIYYHHTGYPGGIKERRADKILDGRFPERVIEAAVKRMVPKGPLGRDVLRKLHVYKGGEHPHAGQQPAALDVAAMNRKNSTQEAAHG